MSRAPFPTIAFATLLCGGVAIGFAGILMRLSPVAPVASAFWRMALAAPLLWIWTALTRQSESAAARRTGFSRALVLAGLFFAGDIGIWHVSLHYTTVANATLLSNFAPVFIALWMWLAMGERLSSAFVASMLIALAGAVLLVGPSAAAGAEPLLGDVLGLITAVFYAGYQLIVKNAREEYSTARLMAWTSTVTAVALFPFALLSSGPLVPQQLSGWLPLVALAVIAQIGGQTSIAYALAHLPASFSSVSLLIQPCTAAVAAWILLGERMSAPQITGGLLVLAGIWLSKRTS